SFIARPAIAFSHCCSRRIAGARDERVEAPPEEGDAVRVRSLPRDGAGLSPGACARHRWVERQVRHSTWWALPSFIETMRWFKMRRQRVHQLSTSPATRKGLGMSYGS